MKITRSKKGNVSIQLSPDEIDTFMSNCYKPYHQSSTEYFHELYDKLSVKIDKWNGIDTTDDE